MAFRLGPRLALTVPDLGAAAEYYVRHFGMGLVHDGVSATLTAGSLSVSLTLGEPQPLVFELLGERVSQSRTLLRRAGFEELVWHNSSRPRLVQDPFGLRFSVNVERNLVDWTKVAAALDGPFKPVVGALVPDVEACAKFYSVLLDSPAARLADCSWIVEGGPLRLRLLEGPIASPVVWLRPNGGSALHQAGCTPLSDTVFSDVWGVLWALDLSPVTARAVVCL